MGLAKVLLLFVFIQAISPLIPPRAVRGDILSPLLSPVLNGLCNIAECGKGSCKVSMNHSFGFICECKPGWSQVHFGDHFRFLPCIIPNCSINYSCSSSSAAPAPSPAPPPPTNLSLFDPCTWAYCGGGKCSQTGTYEHRCDCDEGFTNLLNVTSFACYRQCSLGANCADLGINLSNSSSNGSSSPKVLESGSSSGGDGIAPKNLLWLPILAISAMVLRAP